MIRVIRTLPPSAPAFGIALDEALLETTKREDIDILRMWVNDRAVVIGRSQAAKDEADLEAAEKLGIPVIRRISGGGAVYHYSGNLNISLYLTDARRLGGVVDAFQRMGKAISFGLHKLGVNAKSAGNELLINGAKIGGAAQARRGRSLLYHTTLLVHPDSIPMKQLLLALRPGYRPSRVPSRPRRTMSISEAMGHDFRIEDIADAIEAAIISFLGRAAVEWKIDGAVMERAKALMQDKYETDRWNLQL